MEVSSTTSLETQRAQLFKNGADAIITEGEDKSLQKQILPSGNLVPIELNSLIENLQPGDQIIVTSLEIFCWSLFDCLRFMDEIHEQNATLLTLESEEDAVFPSILYFHQLVLLGFAKARETQRLELEFKYLGCKIKKKKKIDYYIFDLLNLKTDVPLGNLLEVKYLGCKMKKKKKIDYYLNLKKDVPLGNLLEVSKTTLYRHCEVTEFVNNCYNLKRVS